MSAVLAQEIPSEVSATALSAQVDELVNVARQALKKGDAVTAARVYEELLRLQPDSGEALYQLAIINFRKGERMRGLELIKRAVMVTPAENPLPRLALAKALTEIGRAEEAVQEYERALQGMGPKSRFAEKTSLDMNLLRIKLAAEKRDLKQVKEVGSYLMKWHAGNRTMMEVVATIYSQANLLDEAKRVYEAMLQQAPNNPVAAFYLAGIYERMRQPAMAIKYYDQAIANADDPQAMRTAKIKVALMKGFLYVQENDRDSAHVEFLKVFELDENNVIANMNIAGYLHAKKDYAGAKQAYQRVLTVQPDSLDARYRLAIIFLETNDALNAVRELDFIVSRAPGSPVGQASQNTLSKVATRFDVNIIRKIMSDEANLRVRIDVNPNDAAAFTELGDLLMKQRRHDEAIGLFEEAMRVDPEYGEAFLKAGLIYENMREFEKAVNAYQIALATELDVELKEKLELRLLVASANLELKNGQPELAEQKFIEANKRSPDELPILWSLAVATAQQGELEKAVDWYLYIVEKYPGYYRARLSAAYVYEQLEEEELAISQYKAVTLTQGVPPEQIDRAAGRMDYLQRQTNGFSYAVGYSFSFDDNLNSAREQKYFEYRSDLYASVNYRYKLKKGLKLSVNVSPSYSTYHRAQYDFFNFSVAPSLLFSKWDYDWNLGLTQNTQSSVLRPEQSSTVTQTLTGGASWSNEDKVGYRVNMSYRGFGSSENPRFDADTVNIGINRNHAGPDNTYMSYGYSLTINNSRNVLGEDSAYTGHGVNGRVDKRLNESLSAYVDSRANLNMYHNGDSATAGQRFRRTFSFGFGGGVNYRLDSWASIYADYHFSNQYSNLPVGFIFNELQSIEGRQSASLGSFSKNSINAGVRMNF